MKGQTGWFDQLHACMGDKLSKLTEKKSEHFSNMPDPVVVSASAKVSMSGVGHTHGNLTIIYP